MMTELQQLDVEIFTWINRDLGNQFFDFLMPLLRNRFFWAPLYLFIIIFCIRQYKKLGYHIILGLLITFAMGDLIASRIIKPNIQRIRPCNEINLTTTVIKRVPCGTGYSFPSAHATNHFALAVFMIAIFHKRWRPIWYWALAWAFSISFAQVYVGVHYPIDITVGMFLGIGIGLTVALIYKKLKPEL